MIISILLENDRLCSAIEEKHLDDLETTLDWLDEFPNEYVFPEKHLENLMDLLYQKRRDESCVSLSRKLERTRVNGRTRIIFDEERYCRDMQEIERMSEEEPDSLKEALEEKSRFHFHDFRIYYGQETPVRCVSSNEDLRSVLIVFGCSVEEEREFADYIRKVYRGLWFDEDIEASLRRLEAGLSVRKREILYHLHCIEKEIPDIIKENGLMDNRSMGAKMTISCSPERDRKTVEDKLTKKADNGDVKCELHTKMKKIGNRKPDRIYFCASVPEGIEIDGQEAAGRTYIYKITEHA